MINYTKDYNFFDIIFPNMVRKMQFQKRSGRVLKLWTILPVAEGSSREGARGRSLSPACEASRRRRSFKHVSLDPLPRVWDGKIYRKCLAWNDALWPHCHRCPHCEDTGNCEYLKYPNSWISFKTDICIFAGPQGTRLSNTHWGTLWELQVSLSSTLWKMCFSPNVIFVPVLYIILSNGGK